MEYPQRCLRGNPGETGVDQREVEALREWA